MIRWIESAIRDPKSEIHRCPLISGKTCLTLILTVLLTCQTLAQTKPLYESELLLPLDLYTNQGVLLQAGKFKLEVRLNDGHHSLVFLRQEKVVAAVLEQAPSQARTDSGELPSGIPILGTLHFAPVSSSDKKEDSKPDASEYLPRLPWKALLRVYKSENPENPEVKFVFLEREKARKLLRRDFKLSLKKPE